MTRKEAHRLVKTACGLRWVACCPFCNKKMIVLERPHNWGERTKAKAEVAAHIIECHPEINPGTKP